MTDPDDITPEEIAAIEARCDAATPGPWFYGSGKRVVLGEKEEAPTLLMASGDTPDDRREENCEFAAAARADIPRLLAALRRRDAEIARLRNVLASEASRYVTYGNSPYRTTLADYTIALAAEVTRLRKEQEAWRRFTEQADKTVDKAEAERDAARADLAQAVELLKHIDPPPTGPWIPAGSVEWGAEVRAFLAEMEAKR